MFNIVIAMSIYFDRVPNLINQDSPQLSTSF